MKIISWNTNGIRATDKQGNLAPLFLKYKPDIVCLQETKAEIDQLPKSITDIKGYTFFISPCKTRKGYSGVSMHIKNTINIEKVEYGFGIKEFDDEGRTIVLYTKDFILLNSYFPNGGSGPDRLDYKLRFYKAYLKFIDKQVALGKKIIFCGDVNTAHTEIDLARPKENSENTGFLPIERAWLDQVVSHDYIDIFRHLNPNKKDVYTYWDQKTRARDRNVGWRIDYFFVSKNLLPKITGFKTLTDYLGSDHCPIVLEVK